jgi:small subunit ribosomal protein S6
MFLLDNAVVREDWKTAKGLVTEALAKHGGAVRTARRFDERRLAYPIRGRSRATYLLCYFDLPGGAMPALNRELELSDRVLRTLILRAEAVPASEQEHSQAELAEGFQVPAPPPDDALEVEGGPEDGEGGPERGEERERAPRGLEDLDEAQASDEAEATAEVVR